MSATIDQSIRVKIAALVAGLSDVQALSASLKSVKRSAQDTGLRGAARDANVYSGAAKDAKRQSAELVTSFDKLSRTITDKNALGVFVKDLRDAAKELKNVEASTRAFNNAPFQQGARQFGNKSLAQSAKELAQFEANQNKPIISGILAQDPFQSANNRSLKQAAQDLALFDAQADKTKKSLFDLEFGAQRVTKSFLGMKASGEGASAVLLTAASSGALLLAVLTGLAGAALGLAKLVQEGIRFNGAIERGKIGLASLTASTTDVTDAQGRAVEGMDAFRAASALAETEVKKIQKAAIDTAYEFEDILLTVNSAVAALGGTNVTLSETVSLVTILSRAASAINLEPSKFNTQVKQILSGATTVRTDLARVIFPGQGTREINDQIKSLRESGKLYEVLTQKARIYQLTANDVANTFGALSSNVSDALSQFAADSTLTGFDRVKTILREIIDGVIDFKSETVKLTPTFEKIARFLDAIFATVGDLLLAAVRAIFDYLAGVADYLEQNQESIFDSLEGVYQIAAQVAGILTDLGSILVDLGLAATATGGIGDVIAYIGAFIAFIRDILNIIIGSIETCAGLLLRGIVSPIYDFNDQLLKTAEYFGQLIGLMDAAVVRANQLARTNFINRVESGIDSFIFSGIERTKGGLQGSALEQFLNNRPNITVPSRPSRPAGNFNFKPKRAASADGGESAAKKAERAEEKRLGELRDFLDALTDLRTENARKESEISKEANAEFARALDRRYEKGILSSEEYYAETNKLRLADIVAEEKFAARKLELEGQKTSRAVATIYGKTDFSLDEYNALVARLNADNQPGDDSEKDLKARQELLRLERLAVATDIELNALAAKRREAEAATANEIERQTRLRGQAKLGIEAELADAFDTDGVSDLLGLQKRISDELPRILSETNESSDALKAVAQEIYKTGVASVDGVKLIFEQAGVGIEDLSEETQNFLRLMGRLEFLGAFKNLTSGAEKLRSDLREDADIIADDVSQGNISSEQGRARIIAANTQAAENLKQKLAQLRQLIADMESKGAVTEVERRVANALERAIQTLPTAGVFDSLQSDAGRVSADAENRKAEAQLRFKQGKIDEIGLRNESLAIERQEKQALDDLIAQMALLPNLTLEQKQALAELKTQTNELGIATDSFGDSINSQIAGGLSTFFDDLVDKPGEILQSFQAMVSGMLLGFAKLILQSIILKGILSLLGISAGGSGGGFGGFLSGILGQAPEKKAEGGFISGAGTSISDSVPALLSAGEAVLPVSSVKQYGRAMIQSIISGSFVPRARFATGAILDGGSLAGAGSGSGSSKHNIYNIVDASLFRDYVKSSDGANDIINLIASNQNAVRQLLLG